LLLSVPKAGVADSPAALSLTLPDALVSPEFEQFLASHFGPRGREWLDRLPERVEHYRREWRLEVERLLPGGLLSCCLAVRRRAGEPAVLKLSGDWTPASREALALRSWNGGPTPALLELDEDGDALLLERIVPGGRFADGATAEGVERIARLLAALHAAPLSDEVKHRLPSIADVVEEQIATAGAEAAARSLAEADELRPRLARSRRCAAELLSSFAERDILLHGDLEPKNILCCRARGLVAVDPLPCSGDPAYDAGYWLATAVRPKRQDAVGRQLAARLELDPERVLAWASIVALDRRSRDAAAD
jgi:streptomycin 6-kinase